MTVRNIRQYKDWKDPEAPIGNGWQYDDIPWIRNPSWLTMPTISDYMDQKLNLLAAIDAPGSTRVVFTVRAIGAESTIYTIDWGDGNIETFANTSSNLMKTFYHDYDYNNVNLDGTNAPATITNSVITRNNHGYPNGYKLFLNDIVGPTNINDYTSYYVVNSTNNTFQIATEKDGSPITINANGTLNLLSYKQALVQVTCTGNINYFSWFDYSGGTFFPGNDANYAYDMGWLQMDVCLPELDDMQRFRGSTQGQRYYQIPRLEVFNGYNLGIMSAFNYMFVSCKNLRAVPILNLPKQINNIEGMFYDCHNLEVLPENFIPDDNVIIWAGRVFTNCHRLRQIPKFNLPLAQYTYSMFQNCYSLQYVPNMICERAVDINTMFYNCYSLEACDAEFPVAVRAYSTFSYCYKLRKFPRGINFKNIENAQNFVINCNSLDDYHINLDMPVAKDTYGMFQGTPIKSARINAPTLRRSVQMFYGCRKLRKVSGNFGQLRESRSMFYDCRSLIDASEMIIDGTYLSDANQMFDRNYCLKKLPFFDTSNIRNATAMFGSCVALTEIPEYVFTDKLRYANSMFSSCHSLETVPASLGFDTVLSKAFQVSSLFASCYNLKELPWTHIDISSSDSIAYMFSRCYIIKHVPKITVGQYCTSAYDMFRECMVLEYIPKIEGFQHVQNIQYMFYGCRSLKEFPDLDYSGVIYVNNQTHQTLTYSYKKVNGTNLGASGSLSGALYLRYGQLSSTEIDRFFTNLADISSATSITIQMQNLSGISGANTSIATNKGWTITV